MQNEHFVSTVRPQSQPLSQRSRTPSLTPCAMKYAAAIAQPFNPKFANACNPGFSSAMTDKRRIVSSFDIVTGTQGIAWFLVSPALANDMPSGFYTVASYAGTRASPFSANNTLNTGVNPLVLTTLPYNSTQFAQGLVAGVIVKVSVRVTYSGTVLNRGGFFYCLHEPGHESVSGMSVTDIGFRMESGQEPVLENPCELVLHDVLAQECNPRIVTLANSGTYNTRSMWPYSGDGDGNGTWATTYNGATGYSYVAGTSPLNVGHPVGLIAIASTAGNYFHVEMCADYEFIGQAASASLTPHHSDMDGAALVRTSATALALRKKAAPPGERNDTWKHMTSALAEAGEQGIRMAVPKLIEGVASMLI